VTQESSVFASSPSAFDELRIPSCPTPLVRSQDPGVALVHFFRFNNDEIVELRDIAQPVPPQRVNANGMF
jgi:hypothetical protein